MAADVLLLLPASRTVGKGDVLRVAIDSPRYETAKFGYVPLVDAVATYAEEQGELAVFAVNRSTTESVLLEVNLREAFRGPGALKSDAHQRRPQSGRSIPMNVTGAVRFIPGAYSV